MQMSVIVEDQRKQMEHFSGLKALVTSLAWFSRMIVMLMPNIIVWVVLFPTSNGKLYSVHAFLQISDVINCFDIWQIHIQEVEANGADAFRGNGLICI